MSCSRITLMGICLLLGGVLPIHSRKADLLVTSIQLRRSDTVDPVRQDSRTSADSTRIVWVRSHIRDAFAEILGPVRYDAERGDFERIVTVAETLGLGDRATLRFFAEVDGEAETLKIRVRGDLGIWVQVYGSRAPFRAVRDALEEYWRKSLTSIDGGVELYLEEVPWVRGSPPVLQLVYETEEIFSCMPNTIEAELTRTADSLRLELLGISSPWGMLCAMTEGPATGRTDLDLPSGSYTLSIRYGGRTDSHALVITDSTAALRTIDTSFTVADERPWLLFPANSFAVHCDTTETRQPWCERLRSWIAGREGISTHVFPSEGVIPFRREASADESYYFRYSDSGALDPVRVCLAELELAFDGFKGSHITVETWSGELAGSWTGLASELGLDQQGLRRVSCLPGLPPPAADSISLDSADGTFYGPEGFLPRSCLEERDYRARVRRAQEIALERQRKHQAATADSTVRIGSPIVLPPDPWQRAAAREKAKPAALPPNTTRSPATRDRLLHDLREWQCRGGATVGDVDEHRGAAWYWVEHEGDWYYLLAETTAEAISEYFDLVDRYGEDILWTPIVSDGGPEEVRLGPGRVAIPDFRLYRWRP